ncbi:hypothetical protein D041_0192, partial [Vibrio parahaemolyticus EKP-008]
MRESLSLGGYVPPRLV